jgi:alpha-1,6-mannosyltransferase
LRRWWGWPLLGAGLASEAVYLAATLRLSWWRYGGSLTSWRRILGEDRLGLIACLAGIGVLAAAYLWGWRALRNRATARRLVWAFVLVFALTLFWLLPITSDLFIYLSTAHVFTDLGANPLIEAPAELPADRVTLAYPAEYFLIPSAYGPAWALISAPATLGEHDVGWGLLYLKGVAVAAYVACAWSVERILSKVRPEQKLEGLYLFAWNPLVLLMAVGDGHNDIAMVAAVLIAALLLLRGRWIWSAAALVLSVWIKYVSVIYLPLFALYAWWRLDRDRRWPVMMRSGLVMVGLSVLVVAPFWHIELATGTVKRLLSPASWPGDPSSLPGWALGLGLLLFAIVYGFLLWRRIREAGSGKGRDFEVLANTCLTVSLLAFVMGFARSQPWHLVWALAWVGCASVRWASWTSIALSVVMLVAQAWVEWGTPGL